MYWLAVELKAKTSSLCTCISKTYQCCLIFHKLNSPVDYILSLVLPIASHKKKKVLLKLLLNR